MSYPASDFQAFAVDVWDGGTAQVAIFEANSHITYPILMMGAQGGITANYACTYDLMFVIGRDGLIKYRGALNESAIRDAIDAALAVAAVGDTPEAGAQLLAAYPNPFNPVTRIPFQLDGDGGDAEVILQITDLRGRVVRTLVDGVRARGVRHEVVWDGTDDGGRGLSSGTYLTRLSVAGRDQARLLTLIK